MDELKQNSDKKGKLARDSPQTACRIGTTKLESQMAQTACRIKTVDGFGCVMVNVWV